MHLAENRGRIRRIVRDLLEFVPPGAGREVVDVGCFNGFLCHLLSQFGYATAGIDALAEEKVPERTAVMAAIQAPFYYGNFNELEPFPGCPRGRFAAAILGEVFEHILNHPLGLLQQIGGLLQTGGCLILTTPNPYTLANTVRLLRGQGFIWGDTEFATMPKVDAAGRILSYEGIHYREYAQRQLVSLMEQAGFEVIRREYSGADSHPRQPLLPRLIKGTPLWKWLQGKRLFGSGNYVVGRKRG